MVDDRLNYITLEFQEDKQKELEELRKRIDLSEIIPELKSVYRKNIALNTEEEFRKEISTEEYEKQLKEELNITDPEEGWKEKLEEKYKVKEPDKKEDYTNPDINENETNITYSFEGKQRFGRYIHVPVYKCVGRGTVVINIAVDVKGNVVSASVDKTRSDITDPCFHEEAINAAHRSRFNADYSAPARQKGTITFKFVAQ